CVRYEADDGANYRFDVW
nr:immunoglobulin heavy chain junction region [Macaca mulatta]